MQNSSMLDTMQMNGLKNYLFDAMKLYIGKIWIYFTNGIHPEIIYVFCFQVAW